MMSKQTIEFRAIQVDQCFRWENNLYRKRDERTATLILLASGNKPSMEAPRTFYPEIIVEPVEE